MKIMVASDIHGSALYARELLAAMDRESPDKLLLLGDLLYHGPRNDLPDGYAPKEVIELLNVRAQRLLCVRGNCEAEVDQMVLSFPVMADYCVLFLGGRTVFATHGHRFNAANPPPMQPGDILLHGHTHVPAWENLEESRLCLNPGSVSLPRNGSSRSYMLLSENEVLWKTLQGEVFHILAL